MVPGAKFVSVLIMLFLKSAYAFAENNENDIHGHKEGIELGLSLASIKLDEGVDKETVSGLHLHAVKNIPGQDFCYGLGVEVLNTDDAHYSAMLMLAYYPREDIVLSVSPGYVFEKHEGEYENRFSCTMKLFMHLK